MKRVRPLLSYSNSFGFEMEKDAAGCRALNRNYYCRRTSDRMSSFYCLVLTKKSPDFPLPSCSVLKVYWTRFFSGVLICSQEKDMVIENTRSAILPLGGKTLADRFAGTGSKAALIARPACPALPELTVVTAYLKDAPINQCVLKRKATPLEP